MNPAPPRLYDELADWWPLMIQEDDYRTSAAAYARLLSAGGRPGSVLELGSGGGTVASYLAARFRLTLVDASERMLEVSRARNPGCEHIAEDMRTIRLDRTFDAVFIEDALGYLTTREDLRRTLETAASHCRPGGVCLLAPDHFRETFRPGVHMGGGDGAGRPPPGEVILGARS